MGYLLFTTLALIAAFVLLISACVGLFAFSRAFAASVSELKSTSNASDRDSDQSLSKKKEAKRTAVKAMIVCSIAFVVGLSIVLVRDKFLVP